MQKTRTITLTLQLLNYDPLNIKNSGFVYFLCLLCNLKAFGDIFMTLYRNVKHLNTT